MTFIHFFLFLTVFERIHLKYSLDGKDFSFDFYSEFFREVESSKIVKIKKIVCKNAEFMPFILWIRN